MPVVLLCLTTRACVERGVWRLSFLRRLACYHGENSMISSVCRRGGNGRLSVFSNGDANDVMGGRGEMWRRRSQLMISAYVVTRGVICAHACQHYHHSLSPPLMWLFLIITYMCADCIANKHVLIFS